MLLEDRKLRQYHNQGRVHFRTGGPSIFTGPSRSKASVSRGGNKELDINEVISGQRHMRKSIHRTSLSFANSIPQMTRSEYDAQLKFADLNESDPTLHTADHRTAVDQPHNKRNSARRIRVGPRMKPNLDPKQQTQAPNAPTGNPNPMSFDQLNSTHLRQRYQASLSNVSAVQSYGRRGLQMGIRKEKTFEELSNPFSASGHYTISQDHTTGEATRKSHLLANFGRRCGANTNERKQLKVADDELNPPAINMKSVSSFARRDDLNPQDTDETWANARVLPLPSGDTFPEIFTTPDG